MASKYLEFLDSIIATLQSAFDGASIVTTVEMKFEMKLDLGTFTGLQVMVFPSLDVIENEATRREDFYDAEFVVVMCERYKPADDVPKAWIRERVGWAENYIFNVLSPLSSRPLIVNGSFGEFWGQFVNRTEVVDIRMLQEHKVFWTELESRFRKLRF